MLYPPMHAFTQRQLLIVRLFAMASPTVFTTAGDGSFGCNAFSAIEFFLCIATSSHQTSKVTPSLKKASRLFISQMRPPNPQFPVPPGAVCRGAIVDQAIQGFFDKPVDALAVAGQRPVG